MPDKDIFMVLNKSIIGQAPFSTSITVVAAVLILLFTIIQPEANAELDFWPRIAFWTMQISVALLGILIASILIRFVANTLLEILLLIVFTGIIASIIISPAYILIENIFTALDRLPDSALDEFAATGLGPALLVQSLETMPALTIVWLLVNLPILINSTFLDEPSTIESPETTPLNINQVSHVKSDKESNKQSIEKAQFLSKLPESIGQNIMYVSSDLHYLNVTIDKGSAFILGSISKMAALFDDDGFLVHRSYWVNKLHVTRVSFAGNNAPCVMQNGKKIPISRSKRKLLKSYFGNNNVANIQEFVKFG